MPAKDAREVPAGRQQRVIALLIGDAILQLDMKEALESIGYGAWEARDPQSDRMDEDGPVRFDAAIVDLEHMNPRSLLSVVWLTRQNIPTIILSGDGNPISDLTHIPCIVGRFSKPLCVDCILPTVVAAAGSRP